jgi:predicted SAM-dependent methyltransferase
MNQNETIQRAVDATFSITPTGIDPIRTESPIVKLNLGCGHIQPEGWVNVDGSNRAWLASRFGFLDWVLTRLGLLSPTEFNHKTHYADLSKRFPWSDDSVHYIFMGEMLEHFTRDDGLQVLHECYRVLRPGGRIRLRVPDNAMFWRRYLDEYQMIHGKPRAEWTMHHSRWIEMFFRNICIKRTLLKSYGHYHKWMYDEVSLILTLEQVGFISVARRKLHNSEIPGIEQVETVEDLTVEAVKPGD